MGPIRWFPNLKIEARSHLNMKICGTCDINRSLFHSLCIDSLVLNVSFNFIVINSHFSFNVSSLLAGSDIKKGLG